MQEIIEYLESQITPEQARAIVCLTNAIWPEQDKTVDQLVAELMEHAGQLEAARRLVVWESDRVIAHARTFVRTIHGDCRSLNVLALATVCTDPAWRGRGLGAAIVQRAFTQLNPNRLPVSLFQTGVPDFYIKLGGRIVDNRFVNSRDADKGQNNPWWDDQVMIYPAQFDWPAGTIDLNGPGY